METRGYVLCIQRYLLDKVDEDCVTTREPRVDITWSPVVRLRCAAKTMGCRRGACMHPSPVYTPDLMSYVGK